MVVLNQSSGGVLELVNVQEHAHWRTRRMECPSQNSRRMAREEALMAISERTGLFVYTIILGRNGMDHDYVANGSDLRCSESLLHSVPCPFDLLEIAMRNEIAKLRDEHVNFRRLLELLEEQLDLFHQAESPDYELISNILYYMIHYPDHFHHPKEDVIFSRLMKHDSSVTPAVQELARQHRVIAESGARLHENLANVVAGALMPRQVIEAPGLMYVTYYRAHMDTEERELFQHAEQTLRDNDWIEINATTESKPDPIFGNTVEERYRSLLSHIAQTDRDDSVRGRRI